MYMTLAELYLAKYSDQGEGHVICILKGAFLVNS